MIVIKTLLMLAMVSTVATTTLAEGRLKKRSASSYEVEGCFSFFPDPATTDYLHNDNSNVGCQERCRDEGYILAATKGAQCQCGNFYPKGHKVDGNQCSTRCRSWTPCYGPQDCCGGPNAYSVSVVGNIDVAKQVLRRLGHEWRTNEEYRNHLNPFVSTITQTRVVDWGISFDSPGWSLCDNGQYMTGMWRGDYHPGNDLISNLEKAECSDAPSYLYPAKDFVDCYDADWSRSFDSYGSSSCKYGYYMKGLYRSEYGYLHGIEKAKCCKPKSQTDSYGDCIHVDITSSFTKKGWSKCKDSYYMTGLRRSSCGDLRCLMTVYCCKMGRYNGESWAENPDFSINVKDANGQFKQCSMSAMDTSASSDTYECKSFPHNYNLLSINARKFNVEDTTPLNVAKPEPVKGFIPVTCSAHPQSYTCTKWLEQSISTSSTLSIGAGLSLGVTTGISTEVEAKFLGSGTKSIFKAEVTATASFNVESSRSKTYTTTDKTYVSIKVPADTEIMINYLRTVQDLEYKWKAVFELLGKYSLIWANGDEKTRDVTTILTGSKREIYAFGTWNYPDTDVIRVVITDKYGGEKTSGCEHDVGEAVECNLKV